MKVVGIIPARHNGSKRLPAAARAMCEEAEL